MKKLFVTNDDELAARHPLGVARLGVVATAAATQ